HLVFYSKTDFKSVCEKCGRQIMNDFGLKLSEVDQNEK
ncbi:unnamed protein product, partial [marine sediment metagenome]